jgi:hypothetical protein
MFLCDIQQHSFPWHILCKYCKILSFTENISNKHQTTLHETKQIRQVAHSSADTMMQCIADQPYISQFVLPNVQKIHSVPAHEAMRQSLTGKTSDGIWSRRKMWTMAKGEKIWNYRNILRHFITFPTTQHKSNQRKSRRYTNSHAVVLTHFLGSVDKQWLWKWHGCDWIACSLLLLQLLCKMIPEKVQWLPTTLSKLCITTTLISLTFTQKHYVSLFTYTTLT